MKKKINYKDSYIKKCHLHNWREDYFDPNTNIPSSNKDESYDVSYYFVPKWYFVPTKWVVGKGVQPITSEIEQQFIDLTTSWKRETAAYSTMFHKTVNNNYLGIIGMGYPVVPFILNDLKKGPEHWFIALKAITKENPVSKEDIGDLRKMSEAWIEWGKKKNLI